MKSVQQIVEYLKEKLIEEKGVRRHIEEHRSDEYYEKEVGISIGFTKAYTRLLEFITGKKHE